LRPGCRDRAYEGGLAGVRQAEKSDICEHFELELELSTLPRLARRELPRSPIRARLEMQVAESAPASFRDQRARIVLGQIGDDTAALNVGNDRAHRNAQDDVLGRAAVAIRALTFLTVLRAVDARIAIVDQRVDVAIGEHEDAAAAAAVSTVGAAAGYELLAPEARNA